MRYIEVIENGIFLSIFFRYTDSVDLIEDALDIRNVLHLSAVCQLELLSIAVKKH
jgi:hypothetical protein